jgi:predicted metal-binding membrane protein
VTGIADTHRPPWGLVFASVVAWAVLAAWSGSDLSPLLDHAYQPDAAADQLAAMAVFALGWGLMTLAMMAPAAAILVAAFRRVVAGHAHAAPLRAAVVTGFLGVWVATGCAFRAADRGVHAAVDAIPFLTARPELIPAMGLVIAGAFQFMPLKRRCLTACRSPAGFIYRGWGRRGAYRDALAIGAAFGASCVGCCWALMLVMFGVSMSSLAVMLGLAGVMAAERAGRIGDAVVHPVGVALVAAGVAVAV